MAGHAPHEVLELLLDLFTVVPDGAATALWPMGSRWRLAVHGAI